MQKTLQDKIEDVLLKADKPARYCGGEFNTPLMKENAPLNFLMCFPDVYEVAHSNLGIKILYNILNNRSDTACEFCFAPWQDMAGLMRENDIPLFSLERRKPMSEFDIVGFSLQYELSYTNILYMLDLGKIPYLSSERKESDPIIIAGGPCTVNPMPLYDIFDLIVIGDGEDVTEKLAELYIKNKRDKKTKAEFLKRAALLEGVLVPSLNPKNVNRAIINDLDKAFFPTKIQIPNMEAVHNRAVLEIFRGCTRGCRFCQAGMIYRPIRERNVDTLCKYAEELIINNGYDEISLSSLSTCDYPHLRELLIKIKPLADKAKVTIALPSTRVDSFEADFVDSSRKNSLTFAPEAGTQRLRDVINKNVTEEDIFNSCACAFEKGYSSIKLYFMLGLPTETKEDIEAIVSLAVRIKKLYKEHSKARKPLALSVSTSTFVPKPFTPFQWEKQISLEEIRTAQNYLRDKLKQLGIKYSWHDGKTSRVEAAFARGGRELCGVITDAYKCGAVFDGWTEFFDYERWESAFEKNGLSLDNYTGGFDTEQELPWDIVNVGVSKKFLLNEREKAYSGQTTSDCRGDCKACGVTGLTKRRCL